MTAVPMIAATRVEYWLSLMILLDRPKKSGNCSKGEAGRHQQGCIHRVFVGRLEDAGDWIDAGNLGGDFGNEKGDDAERSQNHRRNRDEIARAEKIEGRQQTDGDGTEALDERSIAPDASRERHANQIGWQHGLASRPDCKSAQRHQTEKQKLGLELRGLAAKERVSAGRDFRQTNERDSEHGYQKESFPRERRKDEAKRYNGAEIGDEAGGEYGFSKFDAVEAVFHHHRVDDGNRRCREGDTGQKSGRVCPAENGMRGGPAADCRKEEARHANGGCRKTSGSSSAPARKVRNIAPMPAKAFTQGSCTAKAE
jgi:hypothetical protein